MNDSALSSVMEQAAAAAASFDNGGAPAGSLVTQQPQNTAVAQTPMRPSLDDIADNSGLVVDAYLSVKEAGLRIDKNDYFKKVKATIDLSKVIPIFQVRANRGGNTTFIKSYDGVMTSQGQSFAQATANLQATHDKVDGPYTTVEIPIKLLEKVPGADAGKVLGHTPAITGVKFWNAFYLEAREAGLKAENVEVILECLPQTNKNGNEWGVVGFKLVGPAKA